MLDFLRATFVCASGRLYIINAVIMGEQATLLYFFFSLKGLPQLTPSVLPDG